MSSSESNFSESLSDSEWVPSQTPESEDYTSCESSTLETGSEPESSIACSEDCVEIFSD